MIPKQDRLRPRTVEDLERMHNFKKSRKQAQEAVQIATDARNAASGMDDKLTQEEIFNRLTNNGQAKGFFMEDGQLYINANYIKSGIINADLIKAGSLTSADGQSVIFDLLNNALKIASPNFTLSEDGKVEMSDATIKSARPEVDSTGTAYEYPVTTEIKEGTIILEPDYTTQPGGERILFELLRFKFFDVTYALKMMAVWAEDTSGNFRLSFGSFSIGEVS